jgi:hypothetical protein
LKKTAKQFEDPNLLNLNVHGLPIFSSKTLGIKRADMPQIPREHRQPFLDEIYRAGIGVVKDEVSAFEMYPTQNEISGRNVALKLQKYERGGKEFPRILISKEGRILDGHHHWAMMAAFTLDHPQAKVPVYRLNISVKKALALMHAYDKKHGIERASISGTAIAQKSNPYHDAEGRFTNKGSATQILGQLQKEHGKIMPSMAVFLNVDDQAEVLAVTNWEKWKSTPREVATKDLIAVQPDLDAPGIQHYLGGIGREKGLPSVVEFAGKLYLMDGHHRVASQMLEGKKTISVDVHVQPDPLKGEVPGKHTPEGQQKLMAYLEQMTGSKFLPHGSVGKGATSTNDFDIIQKPLSAADEEKLLAESHAAEQKIWDQVEAGTLTKHAAMEQMYGDSPDPITEAMQQIGFDHEPGVEFDMSPTGVSGDPEVAVMRFHNPKTQHRVEVWIPLLTQKADKSGRYVTPFVSFDNQGNAQLQLIASLNASRLATWGFTAEAEVRGIARYRLTAVIDGRTSEFCRIVDGKIFNVPDARKKVIECLDVQDPNDLKTVQPWPKQTKASLAEYEKMSPSQLTEQGLHIPPYHPLCRTLLKAVTSSAGELTEPTPTIPAPAQAFQAVTQADLKELGVNATPEQVDQWNAQIGMSPVELISKLTGMRPQDVMTKGVGPRPIQFISSGAIALHAKGTSLADVAFALGTLLDPFTGTYYLTQAELKAGSPAKEVAFLKQMFLAILDTGLKSSAQSIAVGVAGNAAYYAKLGFLPDPLDWNTMRAYMVQELETTLQPMMASLGPEDAALVLHLLQDASPSALSALVDLDLAYHGKSIGEWILAEVSGTWSLDLLDDVLVAQAKAYLS